MQTSNTINRQYTLNENYFDIINSEEKAYWLGFLWADGGINKTTQRASGANRLRITQKWSELKHIEKFKKTINTNYPIRCITHQNGAKVAQMDINSRHLCKTLEQLGYGTKDKRIKVPNISENMLPHFVRGYFDGDGCLSLYTQTIKKWTINKQEWSITGQRKLLLQIKDILTNNAGVTPSVKLKEYNKTKNDIVSLRYGKKSDIEKLYAYMYSNCSVYLNSKYQKFVEYFSIHSGLFSNALRIPCIKPESAQCTRRFRRVCDISVANQLPLKSRNS